MKHLQHLVDRTHPEVFPSGLSGGPGPVFYQWLPPHPLSEAADNHLTLKAKKMIVLLHGWMGSAVIGFLYEATLAAFYFTFSRMLHTKHYRMTGFT